MTDNDTTMNKFVWNRDTANAVAGFMEDIEAAQMIMDDGAGDEAERHVKTAVTRFTEGLKGQLSHVGVGYKVELGLIHVVIALQDFHSNEVEVKLKARRLVK